MKIGEERQQILLKMKEAVEKGDRDAVFQCAEELVGWDRELKKKSREIEGTAPEGRGTSGAVDGGGPSRV